MGRDITEPWVLVHDPHRCTRDPTARRTFLVGGGPSSSIRAPSPPMKQADGTREAGGVPQPAQRLIGIAYGPAGVRDEAPQARRTFPDSEPNRVVLIIFTRHNRPPTLERPITLYRYDDRSQENLQV